MKRCALYIALILINGLLYAQTREKLDKGWLVACGDDQVIVIDPERGNDSSTIVWKWKVEESVAELPAMYRRLLVPLDECKPIRDNTQLLLTSSGGATCVLDIATKKIIFYAQTPMAHSAELLPFNLLAVANSTHPKGNSVELYDLSKSEKRVDSDSLYSGHGVVWHAGLERLFVLGYQDLRTYRLSISSADTVLVQEDVVTIPDEGGHDLSRVNSKQLLVTTHHGVFLYNIHQRAFLPFKPLHGMQHIKSVHYDPSSARIVFTKAEESWWTHTIYQRTPNHSIHIPSIKLYKVRPVL
ncbi:DUF6528 family protein [Sphingobacterium suaedae]|uniref:DUF6528 family protein n=1 Tax=Sphingobacterium suaedae TaxID=1686402 RepID=A0ABW5KE56_9SPHI